MLRKKRERVPATAVWISVALGGVRKRLISKGHVLSDHSDTFTKMAKFNRWRAVSDSQGVTGGRQGGSVCP